MLGYGSFLNFKPKVHLGLSKLNLAFQRIRLFLELAASKKCFVALRRK